MTGNKANEKPYPSAPITEDDLLENLVNLGVEKGMTLLVHSSFKALQKDGYICGGPRAVVDSLIRAVGPMGNIVMPAFTSSLSEPSHWRNPPAPEEWHEIIRHAMPPFCPHKTPSEKMGIIAETFRHYPGVLRSDHPQASFCALGPDAGMITRGHSLDFSYGENTPLSQIYLLKGFVLLLGVDHFSNTSLHLAENRADYNGKKTKTEGAPVTVDGKREWVAFEDYIYNSSDFDKIGDAFHRYTGLVKTGAVGLGKGMLMDQQELVNFAAGWMKLYREKLLF